MSETGPATPMKLLELFEEGKRFTEDLLKENERLRMLAASLKAERNDLQSQYVKVDVPHLQQKTALLEQEVQRLRGENKELKDEFTAVEEENRTFADRYVQVERQNSDLIKMYVASYRLHSTLRYDEVVKIVKEIVINMIGTEAFGIYLYDPGAQLLFLIGHEGLPDSTPSSVPITPGVIANVVATGQAYTRPGDAPKNGGAEGPVACIPLKVGDNVMGLILIHELLIQKEGFSPNDFELFELLGGHAATAIYTSKLYSQSERKRTTLEGFLELLRADARPQAS